MPSKRMYNNQPPYAVEIMYLRCEEQKEKSQL